MAGRFWPNVSHVRRGQDAQSFQGALCNDAPPKIVAWIFASLVVLLAILVLVIVFFDWNRIKPAINNKVTEELHRAFAINGNLAVVWQRELDEAGWRAWVPWPHVVAEDLSLGNPDWLKQPQMVTLKRVELRISPLALLAQRVVIPRIDLTEPNANLQRLADGRANWTFKFDPKDPNAEPSNWGWISARSASTKAMSPSTIRA